LALAENSYSFSIPNEITKYAKSLVLEVYSSLDQDVKIRVLSQARLNNYDILFNSKGETMEYRMPASQSFRPRMIDESALPALKDIITSRTGDMRFQLHCDIVPSSGIINIVAHLKVN